MINSLANENSYEVLISFDVSASLAGKTISCSLESLIGDKNGVRFEVTQPFKVLLVPRGSFANLHEPNKSVNDFLASEDALEVAVGQAVNIISPGATVCFKRWV